VDILNKNSVRQNQHDSKNHRLETMVRQVFRKGGRFQGEKRAVDHMVKGSVKETPEPLRSHGSARFRADNTQEKDLNGMGKGSKKRKAIKMTVDDEGNWDRGVEVSYTGGW